ncbi:NTPase KAP family P-loop domain-containing protein 1 [Megalops cyprinoides]|uniref:NTPase KAP family P-loop domain-containing protein 1 n=1 Tax=Megalops cyprinoides TaxID=118141 RepID=UPI001864BE0B|nr:NTPase KAP family P-loop domain-containing protein 1 [Megalops cyprinoides]
MVTKDLPPDSIYGYALSKTLTKVSPPVTVGLYTTCHSRAKMVLKSIEVYMDREAERREKICKGRPKSCSKKPCITYFLCAIFKMLFYIPVWTEQNQKQTNVRYIFVRFSAWHFAGSDMLWAGLVMRLYEGLQLSFGKVLLALYRVAQHEEVEVERDIKDSVEDWRSRKVCCVPLWLLFATGFLTALIGVSLLTVLGFPEVKGQDEGGEPSRDGVGVLEAFAITALGVPTVGVLRFFLLLLKDLIFNQDRNIRRSLDNNKVSCQLGIMNEVRKEMRMLSCFIQFMEVFERRKIRVVLEITHLDRCTPRKIVGVLDAINILLSDEDSPFISLLAVNPDILVQQLDASDGCFSKEDRGYSFLNHIVTLAFTVPDLCATSKCKVFRNIAQGQLENNQDLVLEEIGLKALGGARDGMPSLSLQEASVEIDQTVEESGIPLISKDVTVKTHVTFEMNEEGVERLIDRALRCIYAPDILHNYIVGDTISMRRIINAVRVSAILMEAMGTEPPSEEYIAAWVVLANQWPCRLSWIFQCVEDNRQRAEIDEDIDGVATVKESKTLWKVFSESRLELYMIRDKIKPLLEQDGDPEMFEKFLSKDFKFTVKHANMFRQSTVNLDHSIQKELSRIRGSSALKDTVGKKTLTPLSISSVIHMSTEDVCRELKRLKLGKYEELIRKNELDGQALVYSENEEIKRLLQMTLGEWTTFSIHFLGISPPPHTLLQAESPLCPSGISLALPLVREIKRNAITLPSSDDYQPAHDFVDGWEFLLPGAWAALAGL